MAFTKVTVVGTYESGPGHPAAGTITFTLTQPMENSNVIVPAEPVAATLDASGHFTVELFANDDAETIPQGVQYGVTEQITGAQPRDYFIIVSHASSPVDISTLMPGEPGWA